MTLSKRFEDALVFAAQLHATQERKDDRKEVNKVPYIAHLLGTASIALEYGANEDEAIAALLHDAVEDQGGAATREEIRRRFGDTVAAIVDGCSDTDKVPKPPWRERKEAYITHLPQASPSVRLVSAADKLQNAWTILKDYRVVGDAVFDRFTGRKAGTLWYYRTLVEAFKKSDTTALVEELDRVVSELERLAANRSKSDL